MAREVELVLALLPAKPCLRSVDAVEVLMAEDLVESRERRELLVEDILIVVDGLIVEEVFGFEVGG